MQSSVHLRLSNLHEPQGGFPPIFWNLLKTKDTKKRGNWLCLNYKQKKEEWTEDKRSQWSTEKIIVAYDEITIENIGVFIMDTN